VADLFAGFQFGADPLLFFFLFCHHSSSRARAFEQEPCCRIECKKSGKKSLARSVVKCEESGGEREREREREVIFTMDCCCCCCRRQVLWECGGQQQSSSWILISPPSSTRRRSLSSHTLQRSSSLLSSSSSALTICTDFQTRISVRRSRRRRKKQHCGGDGAAAAVRKSLGPYSDYSNSNNSSRNVPDTSESL